MKVQEKRRLKKITIMEAALEVWGREDYVSTSLSPLAEYLGMTKPAIYRYFSSKEELLDAMEEYCALLTEQKLDALIRRLKSISAPQRLPLVVDAFLSALKNWEKYIRFDTFNSIRRGNLKRPVKQFHSLRELLGLKEQSFRLLMMYVYLFGGIHDSVRHLRRRSRAETEELILSLLERGFGGTELRLPASCPDIERDPGYESFARRIGERGELMNAISTVLQERGFHGVTLEQIAERAGLSKSTLYNYFRNKDEMLTESANRFVKEYIDYHSELLERQKDFEGKLLAHLALQERMVPGNPRTFLLLKQMVDRDVLRLVEKPLDKPGFLSFLEDGIEEGKLIPLLHPVEYQIIFSFFMAAERIFNISASDTEMNIADWLRLLAFGRGESGPEQGVPH